MNKKDKKIFIANLCNSIKNEVISKVDEMPENWDGQELRKYLSDKFSNEVYDVMKSGARKKDYENTIMTTNL